METANQSGQEDLPSDGTCDACEPDEPQQAVKFCQDCNFAFCAVHADKHHKSSRHQLQDWGSTGQGKEIAPGTGEAAGKPESPGGDAEVAKNTATVERLRCTEHGQEGTLYCKSDEKIICVMCAIQGAHREHQIITLREAYLAFKVSAQRRCDRSTHQYITTYRYKNAIV
ncbi:TRI44 protein, partial [Polyodon spathula]|nr:TRI44 protein [Polyodon spathula]